jgi:hypothetical protein
MVQSYQELLKKMAERKALKHAKNRAGGEKHL